MRRPFPSLGQKTAMIGGMLVKGYYHLGYIRPMLPEIDS
ncbi:hypothetical protein PORCRE_1238 [Porphyromonas crevioricanis JCM 15906]|uniref:Uncharacterized protein n=1 Tax=Porphyromonas crevioricanis JCM 15906 TaxID=1305617 RepID=T1CR33_9PORP|nr:hypothetical protein PORCRE_1238 [Porphyromonas crevioricanis JCM 15906]